MSRILLAALIAALVGCGPINRKANFSPTTVTHSASIATMSLETATSICNTVIPFASDPRDDGDKTFSVLWSANVSLNTPSGRVVCAVNSMTAEVERIHDGKREVSRLEYLQKPEVRTAIREYDSIPAIDSTEDERRFSYKGIGIGDSLAKVERLLPRYECLGKGCIFSIESCSRPTGTTSVSVTSIRESCRSATTFGGADVSYGYIRLIDDKVASIELTISTASMYQLARVLTERFGKATRFTDSQTQNRMGATFDNWEYLWKMDSEKLSAKLRSKNIDNGLILISGPAADQQQQDMVRERTKRGAKDF